jgi:hypothetical protein
MRDKKLAALDAAIAEAERFLSAAKKACVSMRDESTCPYYNPDHAAAKRASMDLTRALAAFRRGEPR